MSDRFSLDVHPDKLRELAQKLTSLGERLHERGDALIETESSLTTDWTGDTALAVKREMTALGGHLRDVQEKFKASATSLRTLASDYEDAQKTVTSLNTQWQQAQTAHTTAVSAAEAARERGLKNAPPRNRFERQEYDTIRQRSLDDAATELGTATRNLNQSFSLTKQWLASRTGETGRALAEATVVKVSDSNVDEFRAKGEVPDSLNRTALENLRYGLQARLDEVEEMAESDAKKYAAEAKEDVAAIEELLGDDRTHIKDPDALKALLQEFGDRADDPAYARALTDALGADGLNDLWDRLDFHLSSYNGNGETFEEWVEPMNALSDVIAAGLAHYSVDDGKKVADFADALDKSGSSARLGMLANSTFADSRVRALALEVSHVMEPSPHATSSDLVKDNALWILRHSRSIEDSAKDWASKIGGKELSDLLGRLEEGRRDQFVRGLLDPASYDTSRGPVDPDLWDAKVKVWKDALAASTDPNDPSPLAFDALITPIHEGVNSERWDDVVNDVADHFSDPRNLGLMTSSNSALDRATLLEVYDALGDRVDLEKLLKETVKLTDRNSVDVVARNLGFVLAVTDVVDTQGDYGPLAMAALGTAVSAAGDRLPGVGDAISLLEALGEVDKASREKKENFGESWSQREQHLALALAVHSSVHGEPESWQVWQDQYTGSSTTKDDLETALPAYLDYLKVGSPDTQKFETELNELAEKIEKERGRTK